MKKFLPAFLSFLLACFLTLTLPSLTLAAPPTGTHTFHSHYKAFPLIPPSQPVTIMLFVNEIINSDNNPNLNELNDLSQLLSSRSGIKIIRIAGERGGSTYQQINNPAQIRALAQTLNNHLPGNFYVVFGNEVNNPTEWGGQVDPTGYAAAYIHFYQSIPDHNKIKVAPAALDTFHSNSAVDFINQARTAWEMADAYAFNVYHVPEKEGQITNDSYLSYLWLSQQTGLSSDKPLLLTEFSLKPTKYDQNLAEVASFISQTVDKLTGNVAAVTPLIRNPCSGKDNYLLYIHPGKIINLEGVNVTNKPCEKTTISNSSLVCTDFIKEKEKTSQSIYYLPFIPPIPPDETVSERVLDPSITGNISLESIKFPKFERFQETMVSGLKRTLPYEFAQEVVLPGDTKMSFRHLAQGQDEAGNFDPSTSSDCSQAPESEVIVPAKKWGKLAGAIRGLCTYLGFCPPVARYQFHLAEAGPSCSAGACLAGQDVADQNLSELENKSTDFSASGWLDKVVKTSAEVVGDLLKITIETKKYREVKFLSRSSLSGGKETAKNIEFLYNQLPLKTIKATKPKDQASALAVPFEYNVALSPDEPGQYSGSYYELRKMRNAYCMRLCSLYPYGTSISAVDPICPSCHPKDYQVIAEMEDVELDMSLCQNPSPTGCDYYDPNATEGCGPNQDPVCESGRCNPLEISMRKDYEESGCIPPFEGECTNPALCVKASFSPNPEGGYGKCRYKNATVCVRADRVAIGSCAAVCNWACCNY